MGFDSAFKGLIIPVVLHMKRVDGKMEEELI
jgi:hypothetical protein